jgi:hypothetical protein
MSFVLLLTGSAGFLFSFTLLHAGLARMSVRYPLAILFAYCIFLSLLGLWLRLQGRRTARRSPDLDLSHVDLGAGGSASAAPDPPFGGGGSFAGGGSGGGWAQTLNGQGGDFAPAINPAGGGSGGGGGWGSGVLDGVDLDLGDEGCAGVLALVALALAILAGLLASVYVVWVAPALLAEVLVDGLLVAGLYKRVRRVERRHWLRAALRRTLVPLALCVLFFGAAGYAMQRAVPEARTVGEFWRGLFPR